MPGAGRSENKPVWRDKSAIRGQIRGRPLLFVPVEGDNTENMSESEEGLSFLCARLVASDDCDAKALRIVCGKLGALLERGKTEKSALSDDECACVEAAAVKLWNASVALRNAFTQHSETSEPEPSDTPTTVALLRGTALALLQLVVAAMPNTLTSAEVRTRILSIAVAAGRAFQDITDNRNAEGAFEIASQYAQDESDEFVIQKVVKESAMLLVYKAELMWTTSQSNVAFHLMNRVCSPRFLEMIGIREIDVIANTCIKLSKSVQHASDSVQWLKIALNLYSSIAPSPKTAKRKVCPVLSRRGINPSR
ncbi:hypothetical protein BC830DRAFT_688178 [Chytriomyces sp. MP71]|nr:hypothetical protein BC830DRAFT_688178 [Chytriomyces sp. MP71]